jgi:hypothetical protein
LVHARSNVARVTTDDTTTGNNSLIDRGSDDDIEAALIELESTHFLLFQALGPSIGSDRRKALDKASASLVFVLLGTLQANIADLRYVLTGEEDDDEDAEPEKAADKSD